MTLKKTLLTYHPNTQTPFFYTQAWKRPTNLFLSMFDVDPPLRFIRLLSLLLPKTILQSRQNTMHACYSSTYGLDIKHKSNKIYITHALGWEKYSFINLKMNQLTIMIETSHRSSILILGSSSSLTSNCFA
jgi:hypothetical protein